jgi:hypothetical protein
MRSTIPSPLRTERVEHRAGRLLEAIREPGPATPAKAAGARWARVPMFLMFRAVKPAAGSAITPRQGGAPARGQVAGDATLAASDLEGVGPPGAGTSAKDASRSSQ